MAAITSANVAILQGYEVGTRSGKFLAYGMVAAITLTAQGATAGDIPASVFGLKQITHVREISGVIGGNPRHIPMQIANYGQDNNYIYPLNVLEAVDANRGTPANITGVVTVYLEGIPASS